MADVEEKEKAEKMAAAKKRYEQLKKQKAKDGAGTKKKKKAKDDVTDPSKAGGEGGENSRVDEAGNEDGADELQEDGDAENGDTTEKRSSRLEQLEKDHNEEMEKLKIELTSLQRQNAQLQSQRRRTSSTASPPSQTSSESLTAQLASKTNTIETLELEVSNLRHSLNTAETRSSDLESRIKAAEESAKAAEQRLTHLKSSLEAANKDSSAKEEDKSNSDTRIALLTSDLSAAQHNASTAQSRVDSLEKKIETLNTLHRENEKRFQTQIQAKNSDLEKSRGETADLRRKMNASTTDNARLRDGQNPTTRKSVDGDGGGIEELEEEERARLHARLRQLEGELFDARRGVWRQKRRELQGEPGPTEEENGVASPGSFDEIDLDAPAAGAGMTDKRRTGSAGVGGFATGLFNAFTGTGGRDVNGATGGFEDDMDFDEGAFAQAQETEAKARLERVKEIKRGLGGWRGWRVDLVDVRGGAMAGVFDV